MKPYDFQVADLATLKKAGNNALLNIQPGGGKTPLSIWATLEASPDQVLVIAPLNTHEDTWIRTVQLLAGVELRRIGNSRKAERLALQDFELGFPGWYLVTPQLFTRMDIEDWLPDQVIVDEIHMLNNPKKAGQKKLEALALRSGARLGLSGTPARRAFERNWGNMRALWPHLEGRGEVAHRNYYVWLADRMSHEEIYTNQRDYNGNVKKAKKWLAEKEPGLLFSEAPCVIQHFRREKCCAFHPTGFLPLEEPQVIKRKVELTPGQKRAIRELEEQFLAWLGENPLIVELPMTLQQRIRQICLGVPSVSYSEVNGELKADVWFEDDCVSPFTDEVLHILDELDEGEPVVIFLESQRFAEVLVKKLNKAGYKAAEFSGKTVKERNEYLQRFGKDIQIIVGTITSIGTGTDGLQKIASTEIWVERSVDDTANEQTESRLDRMGAKQQVQRYIVTDDLGFADGRLSDQLQKRLAINKSTRKAV